MSFMISEVKEVREFNINIPILDLKLICTLFFFTKAPEMDFIPNKGDVQLKIYNNNKQLKEFFVSNLSEIWYGELESHFHPPYQI